MMQLLLIGASTYAAAPVCNPSIVNPAWTDYKDFRRTLDHKGTEGMEKRGEDFLSR
jgi:hypothetical protein